MLVNRVGDMFLSIGFFLIFYMFGNLDYSSVFAIAPYINESLVTIIGLLLLAAAMGKSAQFGLHTWLPDAIEGTTSYSYQRVVIYAMIFIFVFISIPVAWIIEVYPLLLMSFKNW